MVPWLERPTLDIDLARPIRHLFDQVPAAAITAGRDLLAAVIRELPPSALWLAHAIRWRTANRFQREAVSLARLVGADWRAVMLANVSYDLVLARLGCSTVALPTPGGPVLARNMDWWPEEVLARSSYLVRYHRAGALRFANAGWPGAIGVVTGLSGRGFALALNAVSCPEPFRKTGFPVLLHLRRVLEDARDFQEALTLISRQRLTTSALVTLVGRDNSQRVVIERTPTRHALRWPRNGEALVATNDYRLLARPQAQDGPEIYRTTCHRYEALVDFFAGHRSSQQVSDAALLYILSDPSVIQGITAQHIIMRPRSGEIRLLVPRHLVSESEAESSLDSPVSHPVQ
jgi:hypothetical protein